MRPQLVSGISERPPRILVLTTHPVDVLDGADKLLAREVMRGIDAEFTWFGRLGAGRNPQIEGHRIPILSPRGIPGRLEQLQIGAISTINEPSHDLVHAVISRGTNSDSYARLRQHLPGRRRRPLLHTIPGIAEGVMPGQAIGTSVALSEHTATRLRVAGHTDVRIVPPGINLDRWPVTPVPESEIPTVLFAGHSDPDGGAREAVLAVGSLQASGVPCRLRLAMRVRPHQRREVEALRIIRLAHQAGVDNVAVLGSLDDFPAVIRQADVMVFPARRLGAKADVPLTLLEAMATGRPVVTSAFPQLKALGDAVMRVPRGDVAATTAALHMVLTDDQHREHLAGAGRAVVVDGFGAAQMVAAYRELYEELLTR